MDTLRSLGGWLVAVVCVPTVGVLFYQQKHPASVTQQEFPSRSDGVSVASPPDSASRPDPSTTLTAHSEVTPVQWFDAVPRETNPDYHLRGVKSVILLPSISKGTKRFTEEEIRTKVESKFRQAGLKVVSEQAQATPASAVVAVDVHAAELKELDVLYSYSVRTTVCRPAVTKDYDGDRLTRGLACVWFEDSSGCVGSLVVRETCISAVERHIEKLANTIAFVNGK